MLELFWKGQEARTNEFSDFKNLQLTRYSTGYNGCTKDRWKEMTHTRPIYNLNSNFDAEKTKKEHLEAKQSQYLKTRVNTTTESH